MVMDMSAGSEKHKVETVASRNHRFEYGAGTDLGAAAEYRLDRDRALRDRCPGHRKVLIAEITLVAGDHERSEISDRQIDNPDRRRRRLGLRRRLPNSRGTADATIKRTNNANMSRTLKPPS